MTMGKKGKRKLASEITFIIPANALLGLLSAVTIRERNLQPQKAGMQMPSLPSEVAHAPGSEVTEKGGIFFS